MKKTVYINDVYIPYLNKEQRTQIFYGGSSSGKSYFLAQRAVIENMQGANYLIVRNVAQTLRHSAFNEITKAIYALLGAEKAEEIYTINKTDMAITCKINRKQILFAGLDNVEKLKSITPINGVIEKIWIEEATETAYDAYKQLTKRLRGVSSIAKSVVLSFNPILKEHWIYKEFFGKWQDDKKYYEDEKLCILKTTYKDNRFLTRADIMALEDETDPYFREVYTLGNWGILGNVIFKNWRVADLSGIKGRFDNIYNGLDFGYTNPNAFVRCHVDIQQKKIYIFDELYKRGQTFDSLAYDVRERIGNQYVTCDSEDGRAINELCNNGVRAIPAKKGADSVLYGIKWLQKFEIIIDVNCQNFKNEIQAYHWQEDKNGNAIEKPVKQLDHLLDALRYATEMLHNAPPAAISRI